MINGEPLTIRHAEQHSSREANASSIEHRETYDSIYVASVCELVLSLLPFQGNFPNTCFTKSSQGI